MPSVRPRHAVTAALLGVLATAAALPAPATVAGSGIAAPRTGPDAATNALLHHLRGSGQDPDIGLGMERAQGHFTEIASAQALAQRDALAASPGSQALAASRWRPVGVAPVLNNTTDYAPVDAIPTFTGRITDFADDPATGRLWAAVGLDGIYVSGDLGLHWRNLTDSLPNTTAGAVGWSTAEGGTLFDGTGDFDGGYLGMGLWRSTDGGAHWSRATGLPDGLMTTRIAVDPTNASVVYAATSRGLFRSADDGRSFVNVRLPVGPTEAQGPDCAGDMTHPQCAFASVVTDVVVRVPDGHDHGGEVLAAVGWERGDHATAKGWSNAKGNGIYLSPAGLPGTFTNLDAPSHGFTSPQSHIGRISLGNAVGPDQNHAVVWAMVQDAQEENGQLPLVDPLPSSVPAPCALAPCYSTNLDNIYLSTDFGRTWTAKLPPAQTLGVSCPVTATDQCFLLAAPVVGNYSPGVQARYNNYIRPDPTSTDAAGNPTRIVFGLEELWEINLEDTVNQNPTGLVVPRTIGRYFGNGFCAATQLPGPVASPNPPVCPFSSEAPTTTHPDQHRGVWVPDAEGGVTFVSGDDGGVFVQHVARGADLDNAGWGQGRNLDMPTTLNYDLAVSGDGVVYTGLQDNGEVRIDRGGRQVEVFGGDAFYSATDPHNSDVVYEEYTFGNMNVSTDGGRTWRSINPSLTVPQFSTPFVMDATDPNHLMTGGEDVEETTSGTATTVHPVAQVDSGLDADGLPSPTSATDWKVVYDLGSGNAVSAVDTRGDAAYVGYCGPCYIYSTVAGDFAGGIATNVGGSAPGRELSKAGWHLARAAGLPQRYVTSVRIDPHDSRTVYVTLANYDPTIEARAPGVLGDGAHHLGHGHVYKSTDAGEHFTDISGNLPDTPAGSVVLRGGQLVVSTNAGVYMSRDLDGGQWSLLGGDSLPVVHATTLQLQPGDPNRLYLATYGHGVWSYDPPASAPVAPAPAPGPAAGGRLGLVNTSAAPSPAGGIALLALGLCGGGAALARRRRRHATRSA